MTTSRVLCVTKVWPSHQGAMTWPSTLCHQKTARYSGLITMLATKPEFWLDTYDATHIISELFGVRSPAHIKHRLEALYWTHWSLIPTVFAGRYLQRDIYDELVGMLSHGCMDVLTSKSSTLPYDVDTMQKMLALARNAKDSDAGLVYHTAAVKYFLF
ncbi:hypothetical protein V8E53_015069 [Lactarius tabidus]